MPFTPLHMGPALLLKAGCERRFSLFAFGCAQILMDIEPLLGLIRHAPVLHGRTHTLLWALPLGLGAVLLARLLREQLEALLPHHLGKLAEFAGRWRERVKARLPASARRGFWERLLGADRLGQALERCDDAAATRLAEQLLDEQASARRGEVVLVGAGPGDPGLLTLHALRHLQQADVVIYDRLVSKEVLALVRRDAHQLFVGKERSHHSVPQDEINQRLLEEARQGHKVVRLKGGDPFIFGRGGEELETHVLARHAQVGEHLAAQIDERERTAQEPLVDRLGTDERVEDEPQPRLIDAPR